MQIQADLETSGYISALNQIHDALIGRGDDADARDLLKHETKLLIEQILTFVPPKNQRQGRNAIQHELNALISEAETDTINDVMQKAGGRTINVEGGITMKDGYKLPIKWANIVPSGNQNTIKRLHYFYKDTRGKVPYAGSSAGIWRSRIVVPMGAKKQYIAGVITRVGRAKAAWCKLAASLKVKIPAYVAQHGNSPFAFADTSGLQGDNLSIGIGSRAPGVWDLQRQINDAVRARVPKMLRHAALIISDYNKSLARSMRVNARFARAQIHAETSPALES